MSTAPRPSRPPPPNGRPPAPGRAAHAQRGAEAGGGPVPPPHCPPLPFPSLPFASLRFPARRGLSGAGGRWRRPWRSAARPSEGPAGRRRPGAPGSSGSSWKVAGERGAGGRGAEGLRRGRARPVLPLRQRQPAAGALRLRPPRVSSAPGCAGRERERPQARPCRLVCSRGVPHARA